MAAYLSAIFRSYRDACDAQRLLDESVLRESGALFLFPIGPSTRCARAVCPAHEPDHAEYAAHGEQFAIMAGNRFIEPHADYFVAGLHEDRRAGHTLLVAAHAESSVLVQMCDTLKDCGAFAIRLPGSRWRLCHSR